MLSLFFFFFLSFYFYFINSSSRGPINLITADVKSENVQKHDISLGSERIFSTGLDGRKTCFPTEIKTSSLVTPLLSFIDISNKCGCVHHVLCVHAQGMRVIEPTHAPIIFLCHGSPEDNAPARTRTPTPLQVTVFNVPIIILYCYCIRSGVHVVAHIPCVLHHLGGLWEKTPKNNV